MPAHRVLSDINQAAQVEGGATGKVIGTGPTPPSAEKGWAPGALWWETDASGAGAMKINNGTVSSSSFAAVATAASSNLFTGTNQFSSTTRLFGTTTFGAPESQTLGGNGATISIPSGSNVKILATDSARTGLILAQGTIDGQVLYILNNSGNIQTFAAAATSNVAGGTAVAIPVGAMITCVYSTSVGDWFTTWV